MKVLDNIEKLVSEHQVEEILTSKDAVARGYVYLVEFEEKKYILVNSQDLDISIARLYSIGTRQIHDYFHGVPVTNSWAKSLRVVTGQFLCALRAV